MPSRSRRCYSSRRALDRSRPWRSTTLTLQCFADEQRVNADPSSQPACIVAGPMVVQPTLHVALFAGVAKALGCLRLAAHCLVGRTTVGVILLVRDNHRLVVQFQAGRAEV